MQFFARRFRLTDAWAVVALVLVIGLSDAAFAAGGKFALVVGNSAYEKAGALTNPNNDANAIGGMLKSAGFSVEVHHDLGNLQFRRVLRDFTERSGDADIAVIFYAGHGIEIAGKNYLIPTDAVIQRDIDVEDETVSLERLSQAITAAKKLRMVILDACRDNPFAGRMRRTGAVARSAVVQGLAAVAESDTLIAFAARAGAVAADGADGNSPFTKALLKHLMSPGMDIRIALGHVRDEVANNTRPKQEPVWYGSLGGATVALVDPPPAKKAPPRTEIAADTRSGQTSTEAERAWAVVEKTLNCRNLEAFIKRFGTTFYADLARIRLDELNNCQKVATTPQPVPPRQRTEEPKSAKNEPPGTFVDPKLDKSKPATPVIPAFCRLNPQVAGAGPAAFGGERRQIKVVPNLAAAREFRAIAFSPDGRLFATAGDDKIVRLWDAARFEMIRELRGHGAEVYSVDFSRDSSMLASTGFDGTVRTWSVPSGAALNSFRTEGSVRQFGVAFYPGTNGTFVDSVGVDGQVWIWDWQRGRLDRKRQSHSDSPDNPTVRAIGFSPKGNGEFLSGGFDGTIRHFLTNGTVQSTKAHNGKVLSVAYAPDGERFATAGVDPSASVKIWTADRRLIRSLEGHKGYAISVAWSTDGQYLVSGGGALDRTVRVWDTRSGRQINMFTGHSADIEGVAFHPNGRWVLSVSEDRTIKVWSLSDNKEILTLVAFEGQYLAYVPTGCHTGTAEAQRQLRLVANERGVERDIAAPTKNSFYLPGDALPALIGH